MTEWDEPERRYPVLLERREMVVVWVAAEDVQDAVGQVGDPGEWWEEGQFFEAWHEDARRLRDHELLYALRDLGDQGPIIGCPECGRTAYFVRTGRLDHHNDGCSRAEAVTPC